MKAYIIYSSDNGDLECIVKAFSNKEKALTYMAQVAIENLTQDAYQSLDNLKHCNEEVNQKNIEKEMYSNIEYYLQELEIED